MKVSILIRTHDNQRTIGRVLEGVRAQLFTDYETIVVDSGSTDRTLEILNKHPHTFVDNSAKSFGYGGSLNAGVSVARGEYVVCLSSHCIPLHERWLSRLVEAMDGDESLAGAWGPMVFDVEDFPVGEKERVETVDLERFRQRPNWGLHNPNSIVRRSLWEEHPFSEEVERCEDQEWAHHFLKQGYRTGIVHGADVFYRVPHGPVRYGKKLRRDFLTLYDLFGYRQSVSTPMMVKRSWHLARMAALGKKSPRVSALFIASLIGRWAAGKEIQRRRINEFLKAQPEPNHVALRKLIVSKSRGVLTRREEARHSKVAARDISARKTPISRKTRFFLVGEMRSGTSWLARTLNTHPEVFCKGEGSFFGRDQAWEEIQVNRDPTPSLHNAILNSDGLRVWHSFTWNAWAKRGETEEDLENLTRMTVDYFMDKDSAASGKRIVGDKSPLHTDHVDEIHAFYPEAKIIHIYRDGRDVAVSLMHHFWRLAKDQGGIFDLDPEEVEKRDAYQKDPDGFLAAGNSIFTEERLRQMAVRWNRRVLKASRDGGKFFGEGFVELCYEDLLEHPVRHLGRLFGLLGARADEATVRRCIETNSFEKLARRSAGQENSASFFRKGVVGDWRGVFTARDREVFEEAAGEALSKMGYSLE